MPYVKENKRNEINKEDYDTGSIALFIEDIECAGDLNYTFTIIALDYLSRKGENYQHINDVIGALEGAKLEFYRRLVGPYEDTKIKENGDVY
jgi:hypothetical protein